MIEHFRSVAPHIHLTKSKVMMIVWRLKGNIIRTVLYIANVLFLFRLHDLSLCLCMFCFTLDSWVISKLPGHFPSCFGNGVTNLNQPPSSFFAPLPLLLVRSWFRPVAPETNLKVGGHWSGAKVGRVPVRREAPEKNFCRAHPFFLALKALLVVLVSAFVMVSTVCSVSCLLFFYSRCP